MKANDSPHPVEVALQDQLVAFRRDAAELNSDIETLEWVEQNLRHLNTGEVNLLVELRRAYSELVMAARKQGLNI